MEASVQKSWVWDGFVTVFLYYVLLTAVVVGGADFAFGVMLVTYVLPIAVVAGLGAMALARRVVPAGDAALVVN